jgi:TrmH family RNA methyltransferase
MRQVITSSKNQRIKDAVALGKGRKRKAAGLFGAEGEREITRAIISGYVPESLFICLDLVTEVFSKFLAESERRHGFMVYEVSKEVFEKLAVREDSGGVFAVFPDRLVELEALALADHALIIAVEGIEKPGNLGALLRSADGAGFDAVVVLDALIDVYNPNVIRSSLGTVFSKQVVTASSKEFYDFCKNRSLTTIGAALSDRALAHDQQSYTSGCAIVLGSEAFGLSNFWLEKADKLARIPMLGIADSLNVAMAGAVMMYEARRQCFAKSQAK